MSYELLKENIERLTGAGYSQAKIAKLCGVSDAALSNYMQGKYNAKDLTSIEDKIRSGVEIELKRMDRTGGNELPFIITETAKIIANVAIICHTRRRMGLIYGPAGVGKTRACREYAKNHRNTIYLEARPSFTARTIMLKLAKMLGCNTKGNQFDIEEEIITKLKNSGKLLIVDECEHLNHRALETLRTVVYNGSNTGMVLVGLETLKYALIGTKGRNEYLSSRCLANSRVKALSAAETSTIVQSLFKDPSKPVIDAFYAETKGNIRLLENTVFEVQRLLDLNPDAALGKDVVKFAAEMAVLA